MAPFLSVPFSFSFCSAVVSVIGRMLGAVYLELGSNLAYQVIAEDLECRRERYMYVV